MKNHFLKKLLKDPSITMVITDAQGDTLHTSRKPRLSVVKSSFGLGMICNSPNLSLIMCYGLKNKKPSGF
ncbi:hypothetical protein [Algoriphagus sp.]|uniref:hypothetical protein n=1 Tax=Algoriphagus sp. TaxID=1872435 RepID=UPI0025E5945D|nr:hypothetical protein [Algoriphagus sp.]